MGDKLIFDRKYDACQIAGNLFIGSAPPVGCDIDQHFDVVVLCASEYQPSAECFPSSEVIHLPFDDEPVAFSKKLQTDIHSCCEYLSNCLGNGKRVLVTCLAGLNRSALICGLLLLNDHRLSSTDCVNHIRSIRGPRALSNPYFHHLILLNGHNHT